MNPQLHNVTSTNIIMVRWHRSLAATSMLALVATTADAFFSPPGVAFVAVAPPPLSSASHAGTTTTTSTSHSAAERRRCRTTARRPDAALCLQRPVGGRHFQLEELEDAETSTTDVLLNADRTVTLGVTNGPRFLSGRGSWSESVAGYKSDDQSSPGTFTRLFNMRLERTYLGGNKKKEGDAEWGYTDTNIGEFAYTVDRTYTGECFIVGGSVFAMTGDILDVDEIFGDRRVGFFNMIDTTEERESNLMNDIVMKPGVISSN
jgi:hypothetical protein